MASVSVIICAHNEQRTIGALLSDVLCSRMGEGLDLVEVLVVADGCTDKTLAVAEALAAVDPRIRTITIGPPNVGKSEAFNLAVGRVRSDILVMFDADVRLADDGVLTRLARAIEEGAVIASGNDRPMFVGGTPRTAGERAALGRHLIKQSLKRALGPACVYACVGRALAMAPAMYCTNVPDLPGEDNFRFFTASERGWPFAYVPDAVVRFYPPTTARDYREQHARFWHGAAAMRRRFGPAASYGSPMVHWRVALTLTLRHPRTMLTWFTLGAAGQLRFLFERYVLGMKPTGIWEPASSTK